jgi:CDP-paratose 2-epimerase
MKANLPHTTFGFAEWFRPEEYERVRSAVAGMKKARATRLRTHLSWADFHTQKGPGWYDWLIPTLGREFDLLPCIHYTPPSISRTGTAAGPPQRLQDYADFIDGILTRYGEHFTHVEIWNEPNNLLDWDWRVDVDWELFCEMAGQAAYWVNQRGWKAVLAGPSPFDENWLDLMGQRGLLAQMSAVGLHGFPGTWDSEHATWIGWEPLLARMRTIIDRYNPDAEIWITEAGYATWRHDEIEQVHRFLDALRAPADRLYWYGWQDIPSDIAVQEGLRFDDRHYHMGILRPRGERKLLARLLETGGVEKAAEVASMASPALTRKKKAIVVVGGAGFIGSNLADSFLRDGDEVIVVDGLQRPGVEHNLLWLKEEHGERVHSILSDVRDAHAMSDVVADARAVFHMAAQVAVTTSLVDPASDFAVNAQGTLNILEAVRNSGRRIPLVFASTNKVYGNLSSMPVSEGEERYRPPAAIESLGIGEDWPLDFCTPYGCSKGAADQYVQDYATSFGLATAVMRMSCIYGPRQFGTEDQGWVAHFLIRALRGEPITVYGDGKQVRDVLHVADAVAAYRSVLANIDKVSGQAFNLGGGPGNAVSLRMVLAEIAELTGRAPLVTHEDWRAGDQHYFVADTGKLREALGWRPAVGWREGLRDLARWLDTQNHAKAPVSLHVAAAKKRMPLIRSSSA